MYSEKFFNVYFYEQMFFEIFMAKRDTGQTFWDSCLNSWIFINKPPRFLEVAVINILIQKYFSVFFYLYIPNNLKDIKSYIYGDYIISCKIFLQLSNSFQGKHELITTPFLLQ